MKIQIGICDDSIIDRNRILNELNSILKRLDVDCEIHLYNSGNEFLQSADDMSVLDILLLDIDMPGLDGIHVAEHLYNENQLTNVIFVTNHEELVFEAIHYSPFRFIRKNEIENELEEAIIAVLKKIKDEVLLYEFGSSQDTVKIPIKDVLYLESHGHYIHIHTIDDKEHIIRGKISDYDNRISGLGFVRIHLGYLVNIRCIYSITSKEVTLDNGEILPISRKNVDIIKEKHANYMRRFVRGVHWDSDSTTGNF